MSGEFDECDFSYRVPEERLGGIESVRRLSYVSKIYINPDSNTNEPGTLIDRSVVVTIRPTGKNSQEKQKDISKKKQKIEKLLLGVYPSLTS